jgi:hypothetical protein
MDKRPRIPTGFELYYRRLSALSAGWVHANDVTLDLTAFGGVAKITLAVRVRNAHPGRSLISVCAISANWRHGEPLVIRSSSRSGPPDLRVTAHSSNISEVRLHTVGNGVEVQARSVGGLDESTVLRIELESTDLLLPLSERSPVNRSICSVGIEWRSAVEARTRVLINRSSGSVTCFTKGNYHLAFPSRPSADGLQTVLLFPDRQRLDLLYGFIRDPSTVLLRSASNVVFAGLGFLAAWLMAEVITSGVKAELAQYLAMLAGLTVPTVTAFAELVVLDRHSLYSRRRDLGFAITMVAIVSGILGTVGAVYLSMVSAFGTRRVSGFATGLPISFMACGLALVAVGAALLAGYRSGLMVPYVCDNATCDNRLYFRYRLRDCYTTGRVVCRSCAMNMCMPCPRNYWQRGPEVLANDGSAGLARWQFRCLSGERVNGRGPHQNMLS